MDYRPYGQLGIILNFILNWKIFIFQFFNYFIQIHIIIPIIFSPIFFIFYNIILILIVFKLTTKYPFITYLLKCCRNPHFYRIWLIDIYYKSCFRVLFLLFDNCRLLRPFVPLNILFITINTDSTMFLLEYILYWFCFYFLINNALFLLWFLEIFNLLLLLLRLCNFWWVLYRMICLIGNNFWIIFVYISYWCYSDCANLVPFKTAKCSINPLQHRLRYGFLRSFFLFTL